MPTLWGPLEAPLLDAFLSAEVDAAGPPNPPLRGHSGSLCQCPRPPHALQWVVALSRALNVAQLLCSQSENLRASVNRPHQWVDRLVDHHRHHSVHLHPEVHPHRWYPETLLRQDCHLQPHCQWGAPDDDCHLCQKMHYDSPSSKLQWTVGGHWCDIDLWHLMTMSQWAHVFWTDLGFHRKDNR